MYKQLTLEGTFMKALSSLLLCVLALTLTACAGPNPYGNSTESYSESEANKSMSVSYGTVLDVVPVTIDSEGNAVGKIGGSVLGGIAGSTVGGGRGSAAGAVAGAIIGGIIGNKAEAAYNKANGVQITVQLEGGRVQAITQEVNANSIFKKGDFVKLIRNSAGKVRVIQ